jgi:hypothetical protein
MHTWRKCSSPFVVGNYIPLHTISFSFFLFRPAKDASYSQPPTKAQFIGLYLNGRPKGIKFRILKFSSPLTEAQRNGARIPRFDYKTTWSSGAFLLCPQTDVLSPSSQRYQDTKGKCEDKCFRFHCSDQPKRTVQPIGLIPSDSAPQQDIPGEFIFSTKMCNANQPWSLCHATWKQTKAPRPSFAT